MIKKSISLSPPEAWVKQHLARVGFILDRTPIAMLSILFIFTNGSWKLTITLVAGMVLPGLCYVLALYAAGLGSSPMIFQLLTIDITPRGTYRSWFQCGITSLAIPASSLVLALLAMQVGELVSSPHILPIAAIMSAIGLFDGLPVLALSGMSVWTVLLYRLNNTLRGALTFAPTVLVVAGTIIMHWYLLTAIFVLFAVGGLSILLRAKTKERDGVLEAKEPSPIPENGLPIPERRQVAVLGTAYAGVLIGLGITLWSATHTAGFDWAALR